MSALMNFESLEGVARITLSRANSRNALSRALLADLKHAVSSIDAKDVRAIVITGAGGCFSAGADFRELNGDQADVSFDDAVAATIEVIQKAPVPAISAIEGACIGAAFDLAMACDLRVVAESAFLELPAIRMGLLYNPTALARIGAQLPAMTLSRLLLLGERFVGREAVECGIASHVVADGEAVNKAMELAKCFLALAPQAVETNKRFLAALRQSLLGQEEWQAERMKLLNSPQRKELVAQARSRHGV
jgi:enoyl-CoA hydratase/carnithine racemase